MKRQRFLTVFCVVCCSVVLHADILELKDGRVYENVFIRDEGVALHVWKNMEVVGSPVYNIYPRSSVKSYKIVRDDSWDERPDLPDLSVIFIEMNPKLPGLHGRVQYDKYGRPSLGGANIFKQLGEEEKFLYPEKIAENVKLKYKEGEEITLTAHVKNVGFKASRPFTLQWQIDGKVVAEERYEKPIQPQEIVKFTYKYKWKEGKYYATAFVVFQQKEICTLNNMVSIPMWGLGLVYVVHNGRINAWKDIRTAYGSFGFEDYYRWHIEMMNTLFETSVFSSAPKGIEARVRLDRIIYTDDIQKTLNELWQSDGLRYDQGMWIWIDKMDEEKNWQPPSKEWRQSTEWSLPHELGHQLGLTDLYNLDYDGDDYHVMPDTGEKVTHFMTHPRTMMHWHGPHIWSEVCAGYLNATWDKPRGYYGDFYFAIPEENILRVVDINGNPIADAEIEIFQRGVEVDTSGQPFRIYGNSVFPVIEDGNFNRRVSRDPVIIGKTNIKGEMTLPNRPVRTVRTLNGFERKPNPFGNMNVVGERGLMLVKVKKSGKVYHYWLEIFQFVKEYFRNPSAPHIITLKTTHGSADSPNPPINVRLEKIDENTVKLHWSPPRVFNEQHYLKHVIGFRIYRRVGNDGLNDRPWIPIATLGPDARELVIDLSNMTDEIFWFSKTNRFGVTTIGELDTESEMVEVVLKRENE